MKQEGRPTWLDPSSGEPADMVFHGTESDPEWMEGDGGWEPPPYVEPGSSGYQAAWEDVPAERREAARRYLNQMKEWAAAEEPGPPPTLDRATRMSALPMLPTRRTLLAAAIPQNFYKPGARPRFFTVEECSPPHNSGGE